MFGEDYNRAVTSGDTLLIRGTIRGQRGRHPGAQWYAHYRLNTDKKCLLVSPYAGRTRVKLFCSITYLSTYYHKFWQSYHLIKVSLYNGFITSQIMPFQT